MSHKRQWLFAHHNRVLDSDEFVAVKATSIDAAYEKLREHYAHYERNDWDLLDELDAAHDLGYMGVTLDTNEPYRNKKRVFIPRSLPDGQAIN